MIGWPGSRTWLMPATAAARRSAGISSNPSNTIMINPWVSNARARVTGRPPRRAPVIERSRAG
jgi:hypothetical protein